MAGAGPDVPKVTQVRRNGPSTSFLSWHTVKTGEPVIGQVLATREVTDGQIMYVRLHPDDNQKVIVGRAMLSTEPGGMYAFYSHTDGFQIRNSVEPIG